MDYKRIIESAYDRTAWQTLLHDIFGDKAKFYDPPRPLSLDKALLAQAWLLGSIELDDGQKIGVYEAELRHVDLARNRVGVRNLLSPEWRNRGFVGAFQFCYTQGSSELRFSYASETWGFDEKNNFRRKSTDTHRYTYLLGAGHRSRTACDQFKKLKASDLTLRDVTEAFSVEAVSKRFFDEYKQNYESIVEFVTGKRMVKAGGKWQEKETGRGCQEILAAFAPFANPEKAVRDYVKKLMGRLVFLQFLQKKGWLGVPKGRSWNDGDREFLRHLFDRFCRAPSKADATASFVDSVLEPLFDDINTRRPGDLANPVLGSDVLVPYLNGGLFERDAADDVAFPLPTALMGRLFDFFDAYNFTIDENDPEDAEVGVDPEMLSRIFENLLEDNKDKGAFYTPKSIVEYMCRESLAAYLQTDLPEADKPSVTAFVRTHETAGLASALRDDVLKRLREVKICDPAIGSGAFPMGLLKELVACRKALGDPLAETDPAALKREIIENNIYGVDIEKGAVDIARLRFWLALVVDEESPHTLPNLDFKIMQGNSLVESFGGVALDRFRDDDDRAADYKSGKKKGQKRASYYQSEMVFDERDAMNEIVRDKNALFSETRHEQKAALIERINRNVKAFISHKLDRSSPWQAKIPEGQNDQFFLWHVWFADVFSRPGKSGFDIVIGNPPYGVINKRQNKGVSIVVSEEAFEYYKNAPDYLEARGKGMLNIFRHFIQRSLRLLAEDGVFTEIFPLAYAGDLSAFALRKWIFKNYQTLAFDAFPSRDDPATRVFESAKMSVCIMSVRNNREARDFRMRINPTRNIGVGSEEFLLSSKKMATVDPVYYRLPIAKAIDYQIICKMRSVAKPLNTKYACSTGEIDMTFCKAAFSEDSTLPEMIRGAGIGRYVTRKHLSQGNHLYIDERKLPRDVQRLHDIKEKERVVLQAISGVEEMWRIKANIVRGKYCANSTNYISELGKDTKLTLAILNSKLMNFFFSRFSTNSNVNGYEVDLLPLVIAANDDCRDAIEKNVIAILEAHAVDDNADTSALEAEIDEKVYGLYGLTPEEREIVEAAVTR